MRISIFNPEHDMALASGLANFTPPKAGRQLRHDLGFLPALWSEDGDAVIVENVDFAMEAMRKAGINKQCIFLNIKELSAFSHKNSITSLEPWGWDLALCESLVRNNVPEVLLPNKDYIYHVKQISSRAWCAENLLKPLTELEKTIGEAEIGYNADELKLFLTKNHRIMVKSPWSCSGRGVRYLTDDYENGSPTVFGLTKQALGWINNVIKQQGFIMMEPYYDKVLDFGMEFFSDGNGGIEYCGMSLFNTCNGAYMGNIVADESIKEKIVSQYVSLSSIHNLRQTILNLMKTKIGSCYIGPFGIDMMIVKGHDGILLHPCVELNLRMTMGHVALSLDYTKYNLMGIVYKQKQYMLNLS